MKTYDTGAGTFGKTKFWASLKAVASRWLDRERELISLRNTVGMMSEARRSDAAEYHEMVDLIREMRADAVRLRWLADDHADPAVRELVRSISRRAASVACAWMSTRTCADSHTNNFRI